MNRAKFQGKPYDSYFEWSDKRIYCSELVWKIYDRGIGIRVGRLQKVWDLDLSDPIVKTKIKERYGNKVPLEETVISPGEMFSSDLLVEPHGQSPWHLTNARVGRHPGQKLAHSSTARGRGFLLPG